MLLICEKDMHTYMYIWIYNHWNVFYSCCSEQVISVYFSVDLWFVKNEKKLSVRSQTIPESSAHVSTASLMQNRHNSIADALELRVFCINPCFFAWEAATVTCECRLMLAAIFLYCLVIQNPSPSDRDVTGVSVTNQRPRVCLAQAIRHDNHLPCTKGRLH